MKAQIQEFHQLPMINLETINEVLDDGKSEYQEIRNFYKHVDEANREMLDEDSDEMVDVVFNYYEACKIDQPNIKYEAPVQKSKTFFAAAIEDIKKNGLGNESGYKERRKINVNQVQSELNVIPSPEYEETEEEIFDITPTEDQ